MMGTRSSSARISFTISGPYRMLVDLLRFISRIRLVALDDEVHEHGVDLDHETDALQLVRGQQFATAPAKERKNVVAHARATLDRFVVKRNRLLCWMLIGTPIETPYSPHI